MPGYDRTRFVDISENDIQEYVCGICYDVFFQPTVTECCGQTYCYDCINQWVSQHKSCPFDRKSVTNSKLKGAPKMVTNLLGNLKIECDFKDRGCEAIVKLSDLDHHKEKICLYNPLRNSDITKLNHTNKIDVDQLFVKLGDTSVKLKIVQTHCEELIKEKNTMKNLENENFEINLKSLLDSIIDLDKNINELATPSECCSKISNIEERVVRRFDTTEKSKLHWTYDGSSDGIQFVVDRQISVIGLGLYGSSKGSVYYVVTIQITETTSGNLLAFNNTNFFSDGTPNTFRVLFETPVQIKPHTIYTVCTTIKGSRSYYGRNGNHKVEVDLCSSEEKVTFLFSNANDCNNGTSIERGQIPEIIFYV